MNTLVAKRTSSRYSSIDTLLGDSQARFFGAGYRDVDRKVTNVSLDTRARLVRANAAIIYPSSWSTKNEVELQPHLSSIDALGIAAQLVEVYLRTAYGVQAEAADRIRIKQSVLKPGQIATTGLDCVAVSSTLVETVSSTTSTGGYESRFSVLVGTIYVELTVEHSILLRREANTCWSDIEDVLGPIGRSYYGAAYRTMDLTLRDVEFAETGERVTARLDMSPPQSNEPLRGMAAAFDPFYSEMTTIVSVAQLAQALLYRYDSISRDQSNNLWMRKILLMSHHPVKAASDLFLDTWCTKMSLLPVKGELWRVGRFELSAPGITGEYTLAHRLPMNTDENEQDASEAPVRQHNTIALSNFAKPGIR